MMTHLRRNYCYTLLSLLAVCLSFTACVPEGIELPSRVKSIATDVATSVTSNSAKLCGVVSVYDTDTISCGIIYDTSSTLSSASGTLKPISANGKYSLSIGGLKANTTYYYRAYALDAGVYKYGKVLSFTTEQEVFEPEISSPEAIDLGLSVKWASCNIGATSPVGFGDYFAWGETATKSEYTESNSVTYGLSILELESRGIIGDNGNLTAEYDAATANWGEGWRMPTLDEIKELCNNCTWTWTIQNGVNGYEVTGPNGNSIFLPAAGYRYGTSLSNAGSYGYYWSATPGSNSLSAYDLYFYSGNYGWDYYNRYYGHTVRPVYSEAPLRVVTIETGEATDITANGARLSGTVSGTDVAISCGFIYGTTSDISSMNNRVKVYSNRTYYFNIFNLQPSTTYYYCAYAIIDGEERYGEVCSFTTEQEAIVNGTKTTYTVNGVSFTMIGVEGGTFTMGSPDSDSDADSDEKPTHQVTLSSYYIGETEVTQELWQAVMGSNPSYFTGDLQRPVERVSWSDCQDFINRLNELTGESFRLPTEAEWEYAARGGNSSKGYKYSGSNTIDDVAWYWDYPWDGTKAVKTKQPNELGIYDMSGNVYEWCADWYGSYSSSAQTNPTGPSGFRRVLRGGSWSDGARDCRVASRYDDSPYDWGYDCGLRLVR